MIIMTMMMMMMIIKGQFSIGEYVNRLPDIVAELPPENYATSKYLFLFLNAVAACSDINKMTETNLAVVFGPNLLRSRNDMIQDCNIINNVTEILIKEAKEVFKVIIITSPSLFILDIITCIVLTYSLI